MSVSKMKTEDENDVKKKTISEKCDENKEEQDSVHIITDWEEQGHSKGSTTDGKGSTTDGKGSQSRDQAKEDTSMLQDKGTIRERSPTLKTVKSLEKESKCSLKCDEKIKSTKAGTKTPITQGNKKKLINRSSQVTAEKSGKSESGRTRSNSYKEKTCDQNTQKMCKPCSDSDIESIQSLRSKIDSAKSSGKSINALLYEMDQSSEPRDKNEENKVSDIEYTQVSFSLQGDELSLKLKELTVSDDRVNKRLVSENDLQTKKEVSSDTSEDVKYQTKGPMSHPKHTQVYQPYPRPSQINQQIPQLVPNEGDFFEAEIQLDKFYDEEDLLKALNEIAPETHPHTSPEHHSERVELLPYEESFSESMPLPNPCPTGVNNQFYLDPVQGVTSPRYSIPQVQPSRLPVDLGYMPCPDPQQRSTSADTIKQTPSVSISYEPRPNSYPSVHKESLEDLFKDASDIIVNDLRQSNQHKSAQKTNANHPAKFSSENPMHQVRFNQQVPANPFSNLPVTRSQPSPNQGTVRQGTLGNQNLTQVIAAKPPQALPNPAEKSQPTKQNPSQRPSNGNLPHILQEITDNKIKMKMPGSKALSSVQTSVIGNNNYPGVQIQFQQSSQMATQFISHHPTGVHQAQPQVHPAQPQVCDSQNPILVPRQTLTAPTGGECMNGIRPHNMNSNHRGANPQQMIELTKSNSNPPPQMGRPNNNQSRTVHGKNYSTSKNMGNASLPHAHFPYPSAFPTMANPQTASSVTSQPMGNGQGMIQQPVTIVPNPAAPFIQHFPNGQSMPSHPYPFQDGLHMPLSENSTNSAQYSPQNGQCMPQPVQVFICPSLPVDNSKPRFRKILPKPPASVEGGK